MANIIKVDKDAALNTALGFDSLSGAMNDAKTQSSNAESTLASWQGDAATVAMKAFESIELCMDEIARALSAQEQGITQGVQNMTDIDNEIAADLSTR